MTRHHQMKSDGCLSAHRRWQLQRGNEPVVVFSSLRLFRNDRPTIIDLCHLLDLNWPMLIRTKGLRASHPKYVDLELGPVS